MSRPTTPPNTQRASECEWYDENTHCYVCDTKLEEDEPTMLVSNGYRIAICFTCIEYASSKMQVTKTENTVSNPFANMTPYQTQALKELVWEAQSDMENGAPLEHASTLVAMLSDITNTGLTQLWIVNLLNHRRIVKS